MFKTIGFCFVVGLVALAVQNFAQINILNALNEVFSGKQGGTDSELLFDLPQLEKCSGENGQKLCLAVLGRVFDVSAGKRHYGADGSYHGFIGRDASRAFITGDFTKAGLTDNLDGLTPQDLLGLNDWLKLYEREYIYLGKLIGRFFDESGEPTSYLQAVEARIESAQLARDANKDLERMFPPCNVEWTQDTGSRVWCSEKSGGVIRNWAGVPRKYFQPGQKTSRCACINLEQVPSNLGSFKLYSNCDPESPSCKIKEGKIKRP